jgi:putative component of membrane protein insertase Oxa1/YidC/SpoIIIJ protein YidD
MEKIALLMIALYKRFISPHKGFSCAYRMHTGRASCSTFGYNAIERSGVITGILLLRRRFRKCASEHARAVLKHTEQKRISGVLHYQSGHCDLPVGDCSGGHDCVGSHDFGVGDCCDASDACSFFDGCSSPCNFNFRWRRKRDDERRVVVIPNSK